VDYTQERTKKKKKKKSVERLRLPEIGKKNDETAFIHHFIQSGKAPPQDIKRHMFLEKKLKEQAVEIDKIRQMQDELLRMSDMPRISNSYYSPDLISPNPSS
jgi:hypothetical protein